MARCSNAVVCAANFFALLIAVPVLCGGYYLKSAAANDCHSTLPLTVIALGAALLVLSILGIFGSCCRLNFFLGIYLLLMFVLIICVMLFMIGSFNISSKNADDAVKEYRPESSSNFFRKSLMTGWDDTERCLKTTKLCGNRMAWAVGNDTNAENFKETEFYKKLTAVQIGCCTPPKDCGFTYVNSSHWEAPKSGLASAHKDCKVWNNSEDGMCYDCDTCKTSLIASTKMILRCNAILYAFVLAYLVIIFTIGVCAFRNNRKHSRR